VVRSKAAYASSRSFTAGVSNWVGQHIQRKGLPSVHRIMCKQNALFEGYAPWEKQSMVSSEALESRSVYRYPSDAMVSALGSDASCGLTTVEAHARFAALWCERIT
jgi:hypothetical protein